VRDLVGCEDDAGGGEEARAEEVGEGVVFFFEEEEGGVGDTWAGLVGVGVGVGGDLWGWCYGKRTYVFRGRW